MSARRAVLLTLGLVVVVLLVAAGAFLGFRAYDKERDRADKAERELAVLKSRPPDKSNYNDGNEQGYNGAFGEFVGGDTYDKRAEPGWYAVHIVRNTLRQTRVCCVADNSMKMQPCRDHWWTPAAPVTIWVSRQPSDDADC